MLPKFQRPSLSQFSQKKTDTQSFLALNPEFQIPFIDTKPSLRWINHLILALDLIIVGSRGVVTEELMITNSKEKTTMQFWSAHENFSPEYFTKLTSKM